MKKVYRWAIAHFIGIAGMVSTMCGAWFSYFTYNNDWLVLSLFGALVTWFYLEVVAPNNKPKVIKKVNIEDKDYTSIFNNK